MSKRKLNKQYYVWTVIILALAGFLIGSITGIIPFEDLLANFVVFVFALVIISILSIVGAGFLGMVFSHRLLTLQGFTPFEEEMIRMREDVKQIKTDVQELKDKLDK
jgi:hypothetical protein